MFWSNAMGDLPIFTSIPIYSHLFPWFTVAVGRSSLPKAQQEKLTMGLKALAAVLPAQFFWKHEKIMGYQDEPGINHGFFKLDFVTLGFQISEQT